jgi:hypothetical protein
VVRLLVFVSIVVAIGGDGEVVSSTNIAEINGAVTFLVVEALDVTVVLDFFTIVVFETVVLLEPVVLLGVLVLPGLIVPFIAIFVAVVFIGIQVCLIISAPFSAIIIVGALVFPLTM